MTRVRRMRVLVLVWRMQLLARRPREHSDGDDLMFLSVLDDVKCVAYSIDIFMHVSR